MAELIILKLLLVGIAAVHQQPKAIRFLPIPMVITGSGLGTTGHFLNLNQVSSTWINNNRRHWLNDNTENGNPESIAVKSLTKAGQSTKHEVRMEELKTGKKNRVENLSVKSLTTNYNTKSATLPVPIQLSLSSIPSSSSSFYGKPLFDNIKYESLCPIHVQQPRQQQFVAFFWLPLPMIGTPVPLLSPLKSATTIRTPPQTQQAPTFVSRNQYLPSLSPATLVYVKAVPNAPDKVLEPTMTSSSVVTEKSVVSLTSSFATERGVVKVPSLQSEIIYRSNLTTKTEDNKEEPSIRSDEEDDSEVVRETTMPSLDANGQEKVGDDKTVREDLLMVDIDLPTVEEVEFENEEDTNVGTVAEDVQIQGID